MKIENVNGASIIPVNGTKTAAIETALERAKAAFMKPNTPAQQQAQDLPVRNATQVQPEEMYAVKPPSKGQVYSNETPAQPEAPVEQKAPEEPLSSQYAALARRERAIRQREQQLRAKEMAAKQAVEAPKAPTAPSFDESKFVPKDRLTQDPFTVLNELGLTYDQLTELVLKAPRPEDLAVHNELKALRSELKSIKDEQESTKKTFQETEKAQREQSIKMLQMETKRLVQNDPQFETIKATNSVGDVVELIERTFDEDGYLMTVEEAAQMVEDHLVEEAMKIARLKKIQQKLAPKEAAPAQKTVQGQQQQPNQMKTLTNSVSGSKPLTARERAILAAEGKLNR